jgi:hypothetical protein
LLADERLDAEIARRAEARRLDAAALRLEGSLIDFVEAAWSSVDGSELQAELGDRRLVPAPAGGHGRPYSETPNQFSASLRQDADHLGLLGRLDMGAA